MNILILITYIVSWIFNLILSHIYLKLQSYIYPSFHHNWHWPVTLPLRMAQKSVKMCKWRWWLARASTARITNWSLINYYDWLNLIAKRSGKGVTSSSNMTSGNRCGTTTSYRWNVQEVPFLSPSCSKEASVAMLNLWISMASMTQDTVGNLV